MITAGDVQSVLLGAGGFIGTTMAGIGAFRFFNGARRLGGIPESLETGVEELKKLRSVIETNNAITTMVTEQGGLLKKISGDIEEMKEERQEISRAMRIMSRKIEGGAYAEG